MAMDRFLRFFPRLRRRRLLVGSAAAIASGYGAYKLRRHPAVARTRRALSDFFGALVAVASAASAASDAISVVSSDLALFLRSESDEIPESLRQISKIARSDEFNGSLSTVSEAIAAGVSRGVGSVCGRTSVGMSDIPDRVLDRIFSGAGAGLASAVAGSFARGLVMGLTADSSGHTDEGSNRDPAAAAAAAPEWVRLLCREECRELIGECVNTFVGTAVAVYLDKTMHINFFDDIFAGLTNPKHEAEMKDVLVSLCNGAVETLVRTSHQVLTNTSSSRSNVGNPREEGVEPPAGDIGRSSFDQKWGGGGSGDGWIDQVTTTMAKAKNRTFILDVTGRITFETVRSFLDFVLLQLSEVTKRGLRAVREDTAMRGRAVLRFITVRSMFIALVCLCLCLRCMFGSQVWTLA